LRHDKKKCENLHRDETGVGICFILFRLFSIYINSIFLINFSYLRSKDKRTTMNQLNLDNREIKKLREKI